MKFLCALCLLCAPGLLVAQALPEADPVMMESETPFAETSPGFPAARRVAVIPFLGEIEGITGVPEITARILEVLGRDVAGIALYEPVMVRLPPAASPPSVDSPPPRDLTGDAKYALCGELLPDEGKYHFQLWLWDMDVTQLVYTDELVCEEFDEGVELLSAMVGWLFSHISQTGEVPQAVFQSEEVQASLAARGEKEAQDAWKKNFLYVGLRVGLSPRYYQRAKGGSYETDKVPHSAPEGALHIGMRLSPNFVVQAEVLVSRDSVSFQRGPQTIWGNAPSDKFTVISVAVPLLVKYTYMPDKFLISPYMGLYCIFPQGTMNFDPVPPGQPESLHYAVSPPLGYTAGITLGMNVGKGILFSDLRYSHDFGATRANGPANTYSYSRGMFSFSIGYELGFFDR
jgi:hypothetical protein